jgi:hypothetical protein
MSWRIEIQYSLFIVRRSHILNESVETYTGKLDAKMPRSFTVFLSDMIIEIHQYNFTYTGVSYRQYSTSMMNIQYRHFIPQIHTFSYFTIRKQKYKIHTGIHFYLWL